ncbi:TIGR00730 family Rossman fold protein [Elioraea tepida]|uniref:Cytokinin riboside 5'-monophosphate phosphoribohydrolase n=1 Tax=Elioraea tepida TaxID=2843330 RepID=A0A975U0X1_9PROT|nr:TIGR00730 family Rossman fold protein [Elioraea tepida]QXM23832.1 TIGR00730 family Rossman fold protein [Elioraea tepida]
MPPSLNAVAVFCGSRLGNDPRHREAAATLGRALAGAGIRLIYGGGRVGLMGVLADACLAAGGTVTGVIPTFLARREVEHEGLTELIETSSMHARKAIMAERADAFVTLPGGLGTYDETIEIITWRQLGLHDKPIVLCDVAGSAAPLVAALEAAIGMGFAGLETRSLYALARGAEAVLPLLATLAPGSRTAAGLT